MANRLQLRRGSTAPGSIFYEGEPIFDLSDKSLYVGNTGATGTGAGTSIASAETFLSSLQILTRATASTAGAINLYEDTDNGTNKVQLIAPTTLGSDVVLTLPSNDGDNGQLLKTDGSGNLSFATPFSVDADTGTADPILVGDTITFTGGEGIDTEVTDGVITISAEDATSSNKGVASFNTGDFLVTSGAVAVGDTFVNTVTTDSGTLTPSGHGLSILGGEGLNVTHTGTTITVAGEDATDSNKGVASFDSGDFVVTSGDVTLADSANGAVLAVNGTTNEVEVSRTNGTITVGLPDNVTIGNDLTVNGNLRVVGTAVSFETQTIKVEDRLIELGLVDAAAPTSATTWDSGIAFNYYTDSAKKSAIVWLNNQFVGIASAISESADTGTSDPQITISSYAPLVSAGLYVGGTTSNDEVINSSKEAVNLIFDGGTYS
jgi:hypothetical protein